MPEGQEYSNSYLGSLYPQAGAQDQSLSIKDVTADDLYMTPEETDAYNQYQEARGNPGTGMLPVNAYYPNIGNNIGVGNSSGSIIGSHTIYAPGAAHVPFGMMDARDAAIQRAALQKQMEVDKFRQQFKSPTSKLTNINDGLTEEYFNFIDNSWKSALKRAGGDPNRATALLKNNPNFWAKEKSYQNLAKTGDAVIGKIADIEARVKAGDVMSPALIEAKNKVLMSMNPNSSDFKNLSGAIMRMDADREFSDAANEALKPLVASKIGRVVDMSNADDIKIFKETIEQLDPEAIQSVKDNLNKIYANSSLYSPEYISRNIDGLTKYKKVDKELSRHQKRELSDDEIEYTTKDINTEADEISGNVLKRDGTTRTGKFNSMDRLTLRKPIKILVPVGTKAVDLKKGAVPDQNVENVQAEIGGVYNTYTYKSAGAADAGFNGMMVDNESLKDPNIKKNVQVTPMVTMRYKTKNEEGDEEIVSTQVPLSSVKNSLLGKKGQNKKVFDEIEIMAAEKTKSLNAPAQKQQSSNLPSASKADWIKAGWSEDQIQRALKAGKISVTQ